MVVDDQPGGSFGFRLSFGPKDDRPPEWRPPIQYPLKRVPVLGEIFDSLSSSRWIFFSLALRAERFTLECLAVYPDDMTPREHSERASTAHWRWQAYDDVGNRYRLREMSSHSPESLRLAHAEWVFTPGLDETAREVTLELSLEGIDEHMRLVVPLA